MKIIRGISSMARQSRRWQRQGERIALVTTMGALHEGHVSLVRAARRRGDKVVVSIFVNPIQFGPGEDFKRYPRPFGQDARLLSREGVDVLFYPEVRAMFPEGFQTRVSVAGLSKGLCGDFRPGHFDGVATVVAKLFCIVRPDCAFFGRKDLQQCRVVEQMARDLNLDVDITTCPTVREKDGLAMSSRNRYLSAAERRMAAAIPAALGEARRAVRSGVRRTGALRTLVMRALRRAGISKIDYVQIVDGRTLDPLAEIRKGAVLALTVRVGTTRLIDNMELTT